MIVERYDGFYFEDVDGNLIGPFASLGFAEEAEDDYYDELDAEEEMFYEEDDGYGFI